jgi:hypothetical protein
MDSILAASATLLPPAPHSDKESGALSLNSGYVVRFDVIDKALMEVSITDDTGPLSPTHIASVLKDVSARSSNDEFTEDDERVNAMLFSALYVLSVRSSALDGFGATLELVTLFSTRKITAFLRRSLRYAEENQGKGYISKVFHQIVGVLQNILLLRVAVKENDASLTVLNRDDVVVHTTFCLDTLSMFISS